MSYPYTVIANIINTPAIVSCWVGNKVSFYLERYICAPTTLIFPPLDTAVMGFHFEGKLIDQHIQGDIQQTFHTNLTGYAPPHTETTWVLNSNTDFMLLYFPTDVKSPSLEMVDLLGQPITAVTPVADPLIILIGRKIADMALQGERKSVHMDQLLGVYLEQTRRHLSQELTPHLSVEHIQLERIKSIVKFIHQHIADVLTVELLAHHLNISQTHLRRLFSEAVGMTLHQYIIHIRLKKAQDLLASTSSTIIQISQETGFNSQSYFTNSFKKAHSITPAQYRKIFT